MNAVVEVETADVSTEAKSVAVFVTVSFFSSKVMPAGATSTQRVISIAGTSISAVSPDYTFIGGTA